MTTETSTRRRFYVAQQTVRVERDDSTGSHHDEWICDARDRQTANTIAEALNLKESNQQTGDDE